MRESLTQTFRSVLDTAQTVARQFRQDFVGTEHLMLGLLQTDGDAARALRSAHADPLALRLDLTAAIPMGTEPPVVNGLLPLSPRAQRLVNEALVAAQSSRSAVVSSRFLLTALLAEPGNLLNEALVHNGADVVTLRAKLTEPAAPPEA